MAWMTNQTYVRQHNTLTVLDLIQRHQPLSRKDIVSLTEMSPAGVTRIVNTLMGLGIVEETESVPAAHRGRKAINLSTRDDSLYTVSVCLEPHRLSLCLANFAGELLQCRTETFADARERAPGELAELAYRLYCALAKGTIASRVRAVGIGVPGIVDGATGIVLRSDQMCWDDERVGEAFADAFALPTWVENDARACLVGEKKRMGAPVDEDIAYLLIGTGLGVACTAGGKLIRGADNTAGEIELMNLYPARNESDRLQTHLIEGKLLARARSADPGVTCVEDIAHAYEADVTWAKFLMRDLRAHLQLTLSMLDAFYNPRHIVLGGTLVTKLADFFKQWMDDGHVTIGKAYEEACMTGAAMIAAQNAVQRMINEG